MPKVALNIFKVGGEYRAVIQVGENPQPQSMGTIVYQAGKEIKTLKKKNDAIRQLKQEAKKWELEQVDENGDPIFVHNIDINPYD